MLYPQNCEADCHQLMPTGKTKRASEEALCIGSIETEVSKALLPIVPTIGKPDTVRRVQKNMGDWQWLTDWAWM